MANVPGLRSPYLKVGRLVYFGRMLDKVRLQAAGQLPAADYGANLGKGFDSRCCNFLRVNYDELKARTLQGGTDDQLLAWCHEKGGARTDEECEIWNGFMMKRGWRDAATPGLIKQREEAGLGQREDIVTFFDLMDVEEGRAP